MLSKGLTRVSLVALVAAMLVLAPVADTARAQSASGDTSFTINVPKVVVLHFFQSLTVDVGTAALAQLANSTNGTAPNYNDYDQGAGGSVTASVNGTLLEANASLTASGLNSDLSTVELHINNAWAVRALGSTVTMTFTAPTLAQGGESITVSNGKIGDGTVLGTYGVGSKSGIAAQGMGTPITGGVAMTLDLSDVGDGAYNGTWTVAAEVF